MNDPARADLSLLRAARYALAAVLLLVAMVALLAPTVAHAQPVDPADAAELAAAAAVVPSPSPPAPSPEAPRVDPEVLLALVAAVGVFLRTVVVPLMKSPIFRHLFARVPLAAQHLLILAVSGAAAALEAYGSGRSLLEAVQVALAFYGTSQLAFGLTAGRVEKRKAVAR